MGVIDSNNIKVAIAGVLLGLEDVAGIDPVAVGFAEGHLVQGIAEQADHGFDFGAPDVFGGPDFCHDLAIALQAQRSQKQAAALFWIGSLGMRLDLLALCMGEV